MSRASRPPSETTGGRGRRWREWLARTAAAAGFALLAFALLRGAPAAPGTPTADRWEWDLPQNLPTPRVPATNPMSKAKVALGRRLFYDTRLSGNGTQSCGSCHMQRRAFTDGRARAVGSTGMVHPRGALSLTNVAYNATLAWANPSLVSLERQVTVPLFGDDPVEMGVNDRNRRAILARLRRDPAYRTLFPRAFPGRTAPVSWNSITQALAAFQRTLISGNSRYDRHLAGKGGLSAAERRGMSIYFSERAECFHCHSGYNLNDQATHAGARRTRPLFHNTGLYDVDGAGAFPAGNQGLIEVTGRADDMGAFRAPTLRNIAVTAPYMHDGSIATLREVVDFYAAGGRVIADGPNAGDGRSSPYKSDLIANITLTDRERSDLVAFLKTFTDRRFLTDPRLSNPFARTP